MSIPAQGAVGAETMTAVDWDHLNNLFSKMPSGPWDASRDTDGHEIRQIDTDPTNKHHWPFRLCRSIPGQRAACDDAVFDFLAGVLNAWPQIAAERSEEAEIERILAMPEDELRKRCLVDGQSPEQTVQIADLAFECASLRAALIQIGQQYVTHRGDMTDGDALEAIRGLVDRALSSRKEVSGQNMSLSTLQGQTANAEATGVEPGAAALASPRADSDERTAGEVLKEACKPWEYYTGEPPDDGSPLSGVFVAGMVYTERLLAKLLGVAHYEGGDGSEDFDADATQTLRNILTGARLWDADENRPVSATPAQPAGAVPDSLREAFEAAELHECWVNGDTADVMTNPYGHCGNFDQIVARCATGDLWRKRAVAIAESLNFVRTLLASHPAGQSAGSGAEHQRDMALEALHTLGVRLGVLDPSVACDGPQLLTAMDAYSESLTAPDSTRTGQGEAIARAAYVRICRHDSKEGWQHAGADFDRREEDGGCYVNALELALAIGSDAAEALAARPAAPEAQGAERVRHVKRGTEYEVLHRGVPLQIAVGTGYSPTGNCLHEDDRLVIYQGSDGKIWAREEREFADGRFEPAPPASSGQGGR